MSRFGWAYVNGIVTGSGGTPGGSDKQIQFNSGSTFSGSSTLTFNYPSSSLQNGFAVVASGLYSHAQGFESTSSALSSHAEGLGTSATNTGAHSEGHFTLASGFAAHSEGYNTTGSGNYSHAEGEGALASGIISHAEGYQTVASAFGTHTEGYQTTASQNYAHAEGIGPRATNFGAHAEGNYTLASGEKSHAEGNFVTASGFASHAEGSFTVASANFSHAEGNFTVASGQYSHAEGNNTKTVGFYSHAGGEGTIASGTAQTVYGKYNNQNNSTSLFIIGNGTNDSTRSDILLVNTNNVSISGAITGSGGLNISGGPTTLGGGAGQNVTISTALFVSGPSANFGSTTIVSGSVAKFDTVIGKYSTYSANFTVPSASYFIGINSVSSVITASLTSAASYNAGQTLIFKDTGGNAAVNNILIKPSGSNTIDGAAGVTITTTSGSVTLVCDGVNAFYIVGTA